MRFARETKMPAGWSAGICLRLEGAAGTDHQKSVEKQQQKNDDRDRDAEHPKKCATKHFQSPRDLTVGE
jgi:hypothetical protein